MVLRKISVTYGTVSEENHCGGRRTPYAPTYARNVMLENSLSARSLDTSDAESDYSGWTGVGGKVLKNVSHSVSLCLTQLGIFGTPWDSRAKK